MSPADETPDVDAEREVDLRSYWNQLVERWWLPAAGLVAGIVIALLVSFGGNQVYTAKTTVYLGQPLSPTGAVQIQSDATNPSTVGQIIHSEEALREAAQKAAIPVGRLRGHVTSRPVAGALTKLGQTPLVLITVTGKTPRPTQIAANDLAQIVVKRTSAYVDKIISSLQAQIVIYTKSLATLNTESGGLSSTERVLAAIQAAQIADQLTAARQQLAVAQEVERGSQKTFAVSTKTTARSRRNTVIVGALIGLLIGIAAALLWEPVGRIVSRPA
jgi:uncharacterized protein involved in exopolysaccharide biosynthesis